jgi:hypothetical protein
MRCAVLDNATLTAVQRLLGEIETENDLSIDGDIAAFESFIQAILFYDTVLYVTTIRMSIDLIGMLHFIT